MWQYLKDISGSFKFKKVLMVLSRKIEGCFKRSFNDISKKCKVCFEEVSRVFYGSFKGFQESFKGASSFNLYWRPFSTGLEEFSSFSKNHTSIIKHQIFIPNT